MKLSHDGNWTGSFAITVYVMCQDVLSDGPTRVEVQYEKDGEELQFVAELSAALIDELQFTDHEAVAVEAVLAVEVL